MIYTPTREEIAKAIERGEATNHWCKEPVGHAIKCPKKYSFDFDQCDCRLDEFWGKRVVPCPGCVSELGYDPRHK